MAFEIAGRAACREGLRKAGARLKEPIMKVLLHHHYSECTHTEHLQALGTAVIQHYSAVIQTSVSAMCPVHVSFTARLRWCGIKYNVTCLS
jgi:translation elongation factor EF-G